MSIVAPYACHVPGVQRDARCATYQVWEDREKKSGRRIGLNVVILPALGSEPVPDPLFILHGGPGAAATAMAPAFSRYEALRAHRDIVMIDQRGTGNSNPLNCDLYGAPPDLQRVVGESFPLDAVRACRERLGKIADLRLYTTAIGMDDVDEVRQWLGYNKINIWGGSYGTVAAQVYLRRHPATVRAIVLLAVAPVDELIPLHHAWAGQRAVDIILNKCVADTDCAAAFPRVRGEFLAILARVRRGVNVTVRDASATDVVRPSISGFAEGIRHSLYADDGRSLPKLIHLAAEGDLAPLLQKGIDAEIGLHGVLAMGMNLSVTCAEDIPYIDDATLARETAGTFLGDLRVKEQRAACAEWPRGAVPADVHQLVHSNVPVLLLSGERDSVTPPAFAERVAKGLPNSLHVVFPEASHGNFGSCGLNMWIDFIARGTVKGLDTSCAAEQKPTKFVW
jgi:pimeloyl-ACP methyl ester carboxylesterase